MAGAGLLVACAQQPSAAVGSAPVKGQPSHAQPLTYDGVPVAGPYAPRDECADLPGFAAFRAALFAAVEARDTEALIALSHPAIKLDFGGGAGIDEFRRRLDAGDALWLELEKLAELGCSSDSPTEAVMPWVFMRTGDRADPFETYWVTDTAVPMFAGASPNAAVVTRLDFDLVDIVDYSAAPENGFVEVRANDGTRGYIAESHLRSLVDYRLFVTRRARGWMIDLFIAGD